MGQPKLLEVFAVGEECPLENVMDGGTLMRGGDIFCVLNFNNIKEEEIQAFQWGKWWFSLRKEQGHVVLCSKVKAQEQSPPWIFEFMFSLNAISNSQWEKFLHLEEGQAYLIHFLLVDKKTNIIKAMRMFGLSNRANQFLKKAFLEQSQEERTAFDVSKLPSPRKSFDSGLIKEKAGTK
jgi:hypothetical protein